MPKYGIHHVVLSDAVAQLAGHEEAAARDAAAVLAANPGAANLGAIGPDLLFWAPDYPVVENLFTIYRNIEEVVELFNDFVEPLRTIRDTVHEPVEDAVETLSPHAIDLTRRALEEMRETVALLKPAVTTGVFAGVFTGFNFLTDAAELPSLSANLFHSFSPPVQDGEPESEWYWFDMLHYRRTGQFAHELVRRANTPEERAYAFGYMSHIATDLVGHPYVNQVVGGPYRMHLQRHVTVENWMDTWKFQQHFGESINRTLVDKLAAPATLPTGIRDLIDSAIRATYDGAPRPGFLSRGQLDETYDNFFTVLEIMKSMYVPRPEEPFSGVGDVLEAALRDFLRGPPAPPSSSLEACSVGDILSFGLTESSRECYEAFFGELADWFGYLGELFEWALDTLGDLVDLLITLLLSLPIIVLLAILYGIQLLLYEIYQTLRTVLALEGYIFPEPTDLETSHGRNLTTTFQCGPVEMFQYPRLTALSVSHLVCPPLNVELTGTMPDFHESSHLVTPDAFINMLPFSLENLAAYANAQTPQETLTLERSLRSIGNARDLTEFMIATAAQGDAADETRRRLAYANWNLDGDRGYGYKTWRGPLPGSASTPIAPEEYVDVEVDLD